MRYAKEGRVWSGAARGSMGAWIWEGSAEEAGRQISVRLASGESWMIFDPDNRVAPLVAAGTGQCWSLDVGPGKLADAIIEASSGFDGVALIDLHLLSSVWGKHGPRMSLWMPLFPLLDAGFTVLDCRLSTASVDKRRRLHHRCGRHE